MPIIAPGKRINPTIKRKTGFDKKSVFAGLYLTSMVDMFAIMVIFLLQSFSAEGELIILPKDIELPKAENVGILERAPSIVISQDKIILDGVTIGNTQDLANQTEWANADIQSALKGFKTKLEKEAQEKNLPPEEIEKYTAKINISADRRLQFQVVKKVIYNAGYSGFPDFRFAVFGEKATPAAEK